MGTAGHQSPVGTRGDMAPHRDLAGTRRGHVQTWGSDKVMVGLAHYIGMAVKNCWEHKSYLGVAVGMC